MLLSVLVIALTSDARAQSDEVLRVVDELMSARRCDAALALLEHAQGSEAELAGRRGICEAQLGRRSDAAAHIAVALRAPSDPWVAANHARMVDALSGLDAAPPPPVSPPGSAELPIPSVSAVFDDAPREQRDIARVDPRFIERFGAEVPPDVPLTHVPMRMRSGRFVLRAFASLGSVYAAERFLGGLLQSARTDEPGEIEYFYEDPAPSGDRLTARLAAGLEGDIALSNKLSLVLSLDLGVAPGALESAEVRVFTSFGVDRGGRLAWGPIFAGRGALALRARPTSGRFSFGLGMRGGFVRAKGTVTPRDLDIVTHRPVALTGTLEGVVELGVAFGPTRDTLLLARVGFGSPPATFELAVSVPLRKRVR